MHYKLLPHKHQVNLLLEEELKALCMLFVTIGAVSYNYAIFNVNHTEVVSIITDCYFY